MIQIDLDEIDKLAARLKEINSLPFMEIEWTRDGTPVQEANDEETKATFKFCGLNTFSYARDRFWEGHPNITILVGRKKP